MRGGLCGPEVWQASEGEALMMPKRSPKGGELLTELQSKDL